MTNDVEEDISSVWPKEQSHNYASAYYPQPNLWEKEDRSIKADSGVH